MISQLPGIQVPDPFSQLCRLSLHNTRISYGEITDILQEDPFLKIFIQSTFEKYLKKGGMLGMLTALGWEGFRNRLAEAYIFYARTGKYPSEIILDEVHDILDIEKRFDFLLVEGNSRVFLFGLYLKLCDIFLEKENQFIGHEFITIPPELDEILVKGKSKSHAPDWLIMATWLLVETLGHERSEEILLKTKGRLNEILLLVTEEEHENILAGLLKYGFGICDQDFITTVRV